MNRRAHLFVALLATFGAGCNATYANASEQVAESGSVAGKVKNPHGLALDSSTGRLFVADTGNNRIDVFGGSGTFEFAFGWGVANGQHEFQVCNAVTDCLPGVPGDGGGQFDHPDAIAVDQTSGDLYVVDSNNSRIERFTEEGQFILTFGGEVNKTTHGNVCTAASGDTCGLGIEGSAEGEFINQGGGTISVGVAPEGTIYVVDNVPLAGSVIRQRLQRFEPSGVLASPSHSLFEGKFANEKAITVVSNGDLFVGGNEGSSRGIRKFEPDSSKLKEILTPDVRAMASGPEDHLFAFAAGSNDESKIAEYSSEGELLRSLGYGDFAGPETRGLAVGPDGVYASHVNGGVDLIEFPLPGPLVYPEPCSVSLLSNTHAALTARVNPEGKPTSYRFQYVTEQSFEDEGGWSSPEVKNSSLNPLSPASIDQEFWEAHIAEVEAEIEADQSAIAAASDPEAKAKAEENLKEDEATLEVFEGFLITAKEDVLFDLHRVVSLVSSLNPSTKYRCRLVAENSDAPSGNSGEDGTFVTRDPFEVVAMSVSDVGSESATLNAEINPLGIAASGHFEYVSDGAYDAGLKAAEEEGDTREEAEAEGRGFETAQSGNEIDLGNGETPVPASEVITGLMPDTGYHYRLMVTDSFVPTGASGQVKNFRTFGLTSALPDDRSYELVSPADKNNAEVGLPRPAGGLEQPVNVRIAVAARSGESVTYTSWTSFADPKGAPGASQYLSRRNNGGWVTENISPPGKQLNFSVPPYSGFDPELLFGVERVDEPALTEDALSGFSNLYVRDNASGALRAITTEPPAEGKPFCPAYAGTSADGKHVLFTANASFGGAPEVKGGNGWNLYDRGADGSLSLVSVLPDGIPAVPTQETSFGARHGAGCQEVGQGEIHNAISADGSRVFWTYASNNTDSELLARVNSDETVQLDRTQGGGGPAGDGRFWGASPDGSIAYFTAPGKLTPEASANGSAEDLYRYDLELPEGEGLSDLTPDTLTPGSEPASVLGIVGASEDGTAIYFVANGVLTAQEANERGETATAGKPNLYLWRLGSPVTYIATLESRDSADWLGAPKYHRADASPTGAYLAFESARGLTGYEAMREGGSGCDGEFSGEETLSGSAACSEVYLYEAKTRRLTCASCNPSGERPLGPSQLPGWSNPFEHPHYLSEDGSRLFFTTLDRLSLADTDNRPDVYEFERAGAGTCDVASGAFNPATDGCLYLLSGGKSTDASFFLDASTNGRDVFLSTRGALLQQDANDNYDVYDARERGGLPESPAPPPICVTVETCRGRATGAPVASSPGTAGFSEAVNRPKHNLPRKHNKKGHKHKKNQQRHKWAGQR